MERDAFLSRVAAAVLETSLPDPPEVPAEPPRLGDVDLLELFRSRAQSVNAVVHGPVSQYGAPRSVVGVASGHGVTRFVAWEELPIAGVAAAMAAEGWDRVAEDAGKTDIATADIGVTGAIAGLAESGSLVLSHGPGRGRLASLLPPIHVALLRVGDIARTLFQWSADTASEVLATSNLVIVTGPSRTGDIEQQLNLGVHGPKHVHIVLIK